MGEQLPTRTELVERFGTARATVQKALKLPEAEGYVEPAQGKGVFARDWRQSVGTAHANGAAYVPAPAVSVGSVELDDAIAEAFEAEHITIDAYCLTAESLTAALVPQVRRIHRQEISPSSIRVRLLRPSVDAPSAIPRNVDDPEDSRPLERLAGLIDLHARSLENLLADLAARDLVAEVASTPCGRASPDRCDAR